jgi:hypothetical protein
VLLTVKLCVRVDLDYVPWDTPDAKEFGHSEPAVLLRMLDLAKTNGYKFHFFASERSIQALPAEADAVLNDGHDLDWLCKRPDEADKRFARALDLFKQVNHIPIGLACKGAWPEETAFDGAAQLQFLSAQPGPIPGNLRLFPVETRSAREAFRNGSSVKSWADHAKLAIRDSVSRGRSVTLVVRPQVLGRFDPKLIFLDEILVLAQAVGAQVRTLRELLKEGNA